MAVAVHKSVDAISTQYPCRTESCKLDQSCSAVVSDVEIAHSGWHAEAEVVPDALLVERVRRMARVDEDVPAVVTAGAPFRAGMAITFHPARELGRDVWHIVGIGRRECWLVLDFGPAKERSASPGDASEDAPHL